jgi:hypothetical protein
MCPPMPKIYNLRNPLLLTRNPNSLKHLQPMTKKMTRNPKSQKSLPTRKKLLKNPNYFKTLQPTSSRNKKTSIVLSNL